MKNIFYLVFVITSGWFFLSCVSEPAQKSNLESDSDFVTTAEKVLESESVQDKLFLVESGDMTSKLTGMQSGTERLRWIKWGKEQHKETKAVMEMMGFKQEMNTVQITKDNAIYTIEGKTATKITADMYEGKSGAEKRDFGYETIKAMGGKQVGTESILGKTCEVWEINKDIHVKVKIWKGLSLGSEFDMGPGMVQVIEATSLKTDVNIDKNLFSLDGYTIQDMGKAGDYMKKY